MTGARIAIVDTETTRLDDDGEVWEIGVIVREPGQPDVRHRYLIYPQRMHIADPKSLAIGRFHERTDHITTHLRDAVANLADPGVTEAWSDPAVLATLLEEMFDGAVLTASNAPFDRRKLELFLVRFGCELRAHYRPVDPSAVAWGYLHGLAAAGRATARQRELLARGLPWSSTDVAAALGIDRRNVHEALPDAEFVRDVLDVVTAPRPDMVATRPACLAAWPQSRDELVRAVLRHLGNVYEPPRLIDVSEEEIAGMLLTDAARRFLADVDAGAS